MSGSGCDDVGNVYFYWVDCQAPEKFGDGQIRVSQVKPTCTLLLLLFSYKLSCKETSTRECQIS